jgi:hypothetical protein
LAFTVQILPSENLMLHISWQAAFSIPDFEWRTAAIEKDAALRTFSRLLPRAEAMSRGYWTNQLELNPTELFAAAHDHPIQGCGESRRRRVAWAGIERTGIELPPREIRRRVVGHFEFDYGVPQFPAVEAMDRLHGQMQTTLDPACDSSAITAFGTFELICPPHEIG